MKKNVGTIDQIVRIVLGLALLSLIFLLEGPVRWVGLAGLVLIFTAIVNWCPIYMVLKLKTTKS